VSSIYFSSSSPLAEKFSRKIAHHSESYLETESKFSNYNQNLSKEIIRIQIAYCDILIVVVCAEPSPQYISDYNFIDNEQVRFEIISAMNQDILIVPVLIDNSKLPEKNNLPGSFNKLLDCRSHHLRTVFWSEDMENLLEHLEEELNFIKEVKEKLTESVEVNYQRLSKIDGRNPKKDKTDLESFDFLKLRKIIEVETIFLQKARANADRESEKNALSTLALTYSRLGQTRKAIQYFEEQLNISRELENFEEVCGLLANLGDAYAVSGNIDRAKHYYEEQRILAESKGLHTYVGTSYNGIGFVFVKQGKIKQAIDFYFKALECYRELENDDKQLELLVGIGLNYRKIEQWEKAIECFEQAFKIAKYNENRKEETQIRVDLAEVFTKVDKRDLAISQIEEAEKDIRYLNTNWSQSLMRRIESLRDF
jgi:tetratricopeptide (TPR) repeat protein